MDWPRASGTSEDVARGKGKQHPPLECGQPVGKAEGKGAPSSDVGWW